MLTWLKWVPGWAWAALGGAIALALGVWWHQHHAAAAISSAVEAERAALRAEAKFELQQAVIDAHVLRTKADMANLEMIHALQEDRDRVRRDAARAVDEHRGLRDTIAALRRGQGAAGSGAQARSLADAAPQLADALGECSGRYVEVAAVADFLTVQVIGLQRFISEVVGPVCIAGQVDNEK